MVSTLGEALRLGWTGLARERWLVPVGLLVSVLRRALGVPALAVALLLLVRGAWQASRLSPYSGEAPLLGAAWVAGQPRVVALVLGLTSAAALLGWLVRLLLLAGALPTLAGAMGPARGREPRFASGVARGLPRLIPTALLGLALEWTGQLLLAGVTLSALRISGVAAGSGRLALAGAVAAALTLALLTALLTSAVADAATARSRRCCRRRAGSWRGPPPTCWRCSASGPWRWPRARPSSRSGGWPPASPPGRRCCSPWARR
jgi:hypothetical protein